ncbi:DinB family protein [Paenibacillus lautus]|uniref:DinB family protein n=1 Tax=Paenibacillus lautus TaxID=1401 RepID=UPI000FDB3C35|nr:DinB family protein [Paenibacillus lautus]
MNEAYLQLYDYHMWANERVWNHLQSLPEGVFLQEVNLGFKSIAEVFGHLAAAEEVWFARIKEESPPSLAARPFANLEAARQYLSQLQTKHHEYLASVGDMGKVVTYHNTAGEAFQNSISEILQQVVNHGTYHRGNITTMLRHLGHKGIITDYIAFLRV